jgi:hypothetical protein
MKYRQRLGKGGMFFGQPPQPGLVHWQVDHNKLVKAPSQA